MGKISGFFGLYEESEIPATDISHVVFYTIISLIFCLLFLFQFWVHQLSRPSLPKIIKPGSSPRIYRLFSSRGLVQINEKINTKQNGFFDNGKGYEMVTGQNEMNPENR